MKKSTYIIKKIKFSKSFLFFFQKNEYVLFSLNTPNENDGDILGI